MVWLLAFQRMHGVAAGGDLASDALSYLAAPRPHLASPFTDEGAEPQGGEALALHICTLWVPGQASREARMMQALEGMTL